MKRHRRRKRHSKKWKSHHKKIIKPKKMKPSFFAKAIHQEITKETKFGLCDDQPPAQNPAYLDFTDTIKWIAIVENNDKKTITFTAIDNCKEFEYPKKDGQIGEKGKRCDCVLTLDTQIVFVELKTRTGSGWLATADGQLRSTIDFFEKHSDANYFLEKYAYIANSMRPKTSKNYLTTMEKFLNDTGYVLRVQNRIEIA
jgi:hypothetical protein